MRFLSNCTCVLLPTQRKETNQTMTLIAPAGCSAYFFSATGQHTTRESRSPVREPMRSRRRQLGTNTVTFAQNGFVKITLNHVMQTEDRTRTLGA
jgi:hypothetical protein